MNSSVKWVSLRLGGMMMGLSLLSACAVTAPVANPTKPEPPVTANVVAPHTEITIQNYRTANGQTLNVTYDTAQTPPTVNLNFGKNNVTLKQTTAWAKGAIYEGEGLRWEAQGDSARLTQGGKRTSFTVVK